MIDEKGIYRGLPDAATRMMELNRRTLVCLRCGNGADPAKPWIQRGEKPPRECWKCSSPYWQTPRRAKAAK